MIFCNAKIDESVASYLRDRTDELNSLESANECLKKKCGIINFFQNKIELNVFLDKLLSSESFVREPGRREYGDFQTNKSLANSVVKYVKSKKIEPDFILEPTCGRGNFILASLENFTDVKRVVGIEIYKPYVWETKFKILSYFLQNPNANKPLIEIVHANVFDFPFEKLAKTNAYFETLIVGNPPWVTNSELGSSGSKNLPEKSNFKNFNGLDAITGKGNFDIGEYISLLMLNNFSDRDGAFTFLMKNSIVKNIVYEQKSNPLKIAELEKLNIDSKKEFNVSVSACLFFCKTNREPDFTCSELDFYSRDRKTTFGWKANKFLHSIDKYKGINNLDGECPFEWRQGVKHDCSKIMELNKVNGNLLNGFKEQVNVENNLLYGILKSSDLKNEEIKSCRKYTIITQRKIGQETKFIEDKYPKTYHYLHSNKRFFDKRKSTIYKGKPPFSIFGVGDYSFAPYKIAISGLYKTTHFTLVHPVNDKPVMLDDTCYFIGFEKLAFAKIAHYLLNNRITQNLLRAIIFPDSKRSITKTVLMRIDLLKIFEAIDIASIQESYPKISTENFNLFGEKMRKLAGSPQMALFSAK
jgi:hypothetical protein